MCQKFIIAPAQIFTCLIYCCSNAFLFDSLIEQVNCCNKKSFHSWSTRYYRAQRSICQVKIEKMPEEEEEFREFRPFCILLASNPSPQVESWTTLEIAANAARSAWKVYIFYLKALAGLKKLTDKSPEKRLEPLQEHLTFPALIYLRLILHSWFCKMICLFCDDVGLWMILLTGSQAWLKITPSLCWTMSPLYIQEYAWRTSFWWKTCWGIFSHISVRIFLVPVPVFFWWVERMYWQARVSSLLLSRRLKAFFWYEITLRKWPISKILYSRLPPALYLTQSSLPYNLPSPTLSSSLCNGQRLTLLQSSGLLHSVSSFNLPTCLPPHHICPFLPPCCQGCWADWCVSRKMLHSSR